MISREPTFPPPPRNRIEAIGRSCLDNLRETGICAKYLGAALGYMVRLLYSRRMRKETLAQFSFLMVIPPILGEALLDIAKALHGGEAAATAGIGTIPLVAGFLTAFVTGCLACKWMIALVRRGKLVWFAVYCAVFGTLLIAFA